MMAGSKVDRLRPKPAPKMSWKIAHFTVLSSSSVKRPNPVAAIVKDAACNGLYFPIFSIRSPAITAAASIPIVRGRKFTPDRTIVVPSTTWKYTGRKYPNAWTRIDDKNVSAKSTADVRLLNKRSGTLGDLAKCCWTWNTIQPVQPSTRGRIIRHDDQGYSIPPMTRLRSTASMLGMKIRLPSISICCGSV